MNDELPELEIIGEEPTPHAGGSFEEVTTGPTRPWWPWLVVLGVVGLVGVVAVAGDGGDDGASGRTPPTVVDRPGGSAIVEVTAERRFLRGTPTPLLGDAVGAVVLLVGGEEWRLVDLDTGFVSPVDEALAGGVPDAFAGAPSARTVALDGRVVVLDPVERSLRAYDVERFVDDRTRLVDVADFDPDIAPDTSPVAVYPAGDDRFWLVSLLEDGGADEAQAQRLDRDGAAAGPVLRLRGMPRAATTVGPVVQAGGRVYVADETGIRDLGPGSLRAAAGFHVATVSCDELMRCSEQTIDARTGEVTVRRSIPAAQAGRAGRELVAIAPDGALASLSTLGPDAVMGVTGPDGGTGVPVRDASGTPAWLPDGDGILVVADGGLVHVAPVGPGLAGRRIDGLRTGDAFSLVVVPV